jgi:hypothetical protein
VWYAPTQDIALSYPGFIAMNDRMFTKFRCNELITNSAGPYLLTQLTTYFFYGFYICTKSFEFPSSLFHWLYEGCTMPKLRT